MRPKYATSYRPHGKWGDFFACIIPVSWCVNILINSNFILRLIEWQNESSLFTIRVRGKQWYWVYKFELKNFTDILSAPKNVGTNKWLINVFGDLQTAEDYHHVLQMRAQNKWVKTYWNDTLQQSGVGTNKNHVILPQEHLKFDILNASQQNTNLVAQSALLLNNSLYSSLSNSNLNTSVLNSISYDKNFWQAFDPETNDFFNFFEENSELSEISDTNISSDYAVTNDLELQATDTLESAKLFSSVESDSDVSYDVEYLCGDFLDSTWKDYSLNSFNFFKFLRGVNLSVNSNFVDFNEFSTVARRPSGSVSPVRLIKNPLVSDNFLSEEQELFRLRFNDDSASVQHKVLPHTTYLSLKQKRYKRKKNIVPTKKFLHTEQDGKTKIVKASYKPLLINNSIFEDVINSESSYNSTRQYRMLKKNKARSEVFSVVTNRRMLRTKRTLVLPAHVNITIVSNSYDVVHSWWIPGLGIKIDCVPGRSTHHTFFVDNVGFYYGQCAEICGRYHHHMPIRICALPFEHFLVWWYSFGLPKLLFTKQKRRLETTYGFTKYVW